MPKITIIERDDRRTKYRVEGGPIAPGWNVREGQEPWCEMSVWHGSDHIGSYGGTVWPPAWPDLFAAIPPSVQYGSGGVRITPAGRAALDRAITTD